MKITGNISTATLPLVLTFCCFTNVYSARSPYERPSSLRERPASPDYIRTSEGRSRSMTALGGSLLPTGQADPNTNVIEVNPILQKILKASALAETAETPSLATSRARPDYVRTVDFYLRDGKLIFGKLVSEDKNKVIVEQLNGSEIVVDTYSRRDIDTRTLQTKNVPTYRYFLDLAEYFSGRTWDFRDDPDDFILAIRCYEKAKQIMSKKTKPDTERIREIGEKIQELQADRDVWARETESRAKLKKLEFDAEFENKLKDIEEKVNESNQKVDKRVEQLDKILMELQENLQKLEQAFTMMDQDIRRQLSMLGDEVEDNRRRYDPFYVPRRRRYDYNYRPGY